MSKLFNVVKNIFSGERKNIMAGEDKYLLSLRRQAQRYHDEDEKKRLKAYIEHRQKQEGAACFAGKWDLGKRPAVKPQNAFIGRGRI